MIVNRRLRRRIGLAAVSGMLMLSLSSFMPAKNEFTAAEQQQVSIATPGLFAQSQAFNVDFEIFRAKEYSFPLPVGKASLINGNSVMRISTAKGDAVKAMFDGYVRLSRKTESMGNVIVIRLIRKGRKEMTVYFGNEVADALEQYMKGSRKLVIPKEGHEDALFYSMQRRRIGVQAVQNLVKKYAKEVTPLKKITPHKLRSTYGTALYQETDDIYLVAEVLGHSDVNTTRKHYAAMSDTRRRQAAGKVVLRESVSHDSTNNNSKNL